MVRTSSVNAKSTRSRVSNDKSLFIDCEVDGRSARARRWRDLFRQLVADLGGEAECSEAQRQLCRRCATLSVACEVIESDLAAGRDVDFGTLTRMTGTLNRLLSQLGLTTQREAEPGAALRDIVGRMGKTIPATDGRPGASMPAVPHGRRVPRFAEDDEDDEDDEDVVEFEDEDDWDDEDNA